MLLTRTARRRGETINLRSLVCTALCCVALGVAGLAAPKRAATSADGFVSLHPKLPRGYEEHQRWVARSLDQMHTVKAGMTRAELNAVFTREGGLSVGPIGTYLYRGCPYFKVRVTFQVLGPLNELPENPKDKILSISEPVVDTRSQPN